MASKRRGVLTDPQRYKAEKYGLAVHEIERAVLLAAARRMMRDPMTKGSIVAHYLKAWAKELCDGK